MGVVEIVSLTCKLAKQVGLGCRKWGCNKLGLKGQGSVNGGFQTVVRVLPGDQIPHTPFSLNASFLPKSYWGLPGGWFSKRVVLADVPPERKPERGHIRQNHPSTKPTLCLLSILPLSYFFWRAEKLSTSAGNDFGELFGIF